MAGCPVPVSTFASGRGVSIAAPYLSTREWGGGGERIPKQPVRQAKRGRETKPERRRKKSMTDENKRKSDRMKQRSRRNGKNVGWRIGRLLWIVWQRGKLAMISRVVSETDDTKSRSYD